MRFLRLLLRFWVKSWDLGVEKLGFWGRNLRFSRLNVGILGLKVGILGPKVEIFDIIDGIWGQKLGFLRLLLRFWVKRWGFGG